MTSMMTRSMPDGHGPDVMDVGPLAWALDRMTPELWASAPSESPAERQARQLAAADILDDLLSEYAADEYVEAVAA